MTTWTKLIEGGGTRFERELLGSATSDAVPSGARARVAERLGLASPRLATSVSLWRAKLAALGRHMLIGVVAGLAPLSAMQEVETSAGLGESTRSASASRPSSEAIETDTGATAPTSFTPEHAGSAEHSAAQQVITPSPSIAAARQPIAVARRSEPRGPLNSRPAELTTPIAKSRLMSEVERLDAARASLHASAPQTALALLDDYDARFARGELAQEAAVLRVHALLQTGRREDALRLARATSPLPGSERYRAEMKRLIEDAQKGGSPRQPDDIGGAR